MGLLSAPTKMQVGNLAIPFWKHIHIWNWMALILTIAYTQSGGVLQLFGALTALLTNHIFNYVILISRLDCLSV